ncbi:YceI family protein [Marivirga sp.]|uniref:YceI family protein n=1 Tax=Marivirga sp. TaxID=2018662 RepID=UPI003DA6E78F
MANKWSIDPIHSEVLFRIKYLVISSVTGQFTRFDGEISSETEDFNGATANFQIEAASVSTKVEDRDNHLRSPEFFDAEKFPFIKFTNGKLTRNGGEYKLSGDLSIRDTTNNITLDVDFGGSIVDGYGQKKAGFKISGKINRKEFGLTYDAVTEAGGVVVGDEVRLILNIQVVKQKNI